MASSLDDVVSQMAAVGLSPPKDVRAALTGYVRWRPDGERKAKKSAWARLFEWTSPKSSRVYITGVFGWRGDQWPIEASNSDWSPEERAAEMEARKAAEKAAREERDKDAAQAATKAQRMWAKGREADQGPRHPYLERKKVAPFGLRVGYGNKLLVPLRCIDAALHGLQYISVEGEKIFGTGTAKAGKFHVIGEIAGEDVPIGFAEGYATGATGHMAMGWPIVVCFDAGNLIAVAQAWRKLYPNHKFVLLADDDRHLLARLVERLAREGISATADELSKLGEHEWDLPDGRRVVLKAGWGKNGQGQVCIKGHIVVDGMPRLLNLENAGRSSAVAAAGKTKGVVCWPKFADKDSLGTDWNDLHAAEGLDVVRTQIQAALDAGPGKKTRATDAPQGGNKQSGPREFGFLDRFTLIYGTTTVWDEQERAIIRLESMKAAFGKSVDWWLGCEDRRMVSQANVVFDPTFKVAVPDSRTHINLFDKLPLEPSKGDCQLIIDHLFRLCHEDEGLFHWVCCWLALPLQRMGTKMRTSLIIHGRMEGTGKSMLGDIMRAIYGRYSRSISQTQLQSEFNGWQAGMLLCVAEEVVSASERKTLKNLIQNMITNPVIQINEKNMPVREERNHCNFMFMSNEQLPMLLNETDRRYTVIKVERRYPPAYFQALGACMEGGGTEAFYQWLLDYELGDFTEFTLPFETKERLQLITLGMTPDQRFVKMWSSGFAGLPFCTVPIRDLYRAFQCWCRINGEKYVANQTQFGLTATEFLDRLEAPPKRNKRFHAYTADQIEREQFGMTESQQGIVYFVPAAAQRIGPSFEVAQGPDADEDCTDSVVYNRRIQSFQSSLSLLIQSARRAF